MKIAPVCLMLLMSSGRSFKIVDILNRVGKSLKELLSNSDETNEEEDYDDDDSDTEYEDAVPQNCQIVMT